MTSPSTAHARAFLDAVWTTNVHCKDDTLRHALLRAIMEAYDSRGAEPALRPVPGFDQAHFEEALSASPRQ